MEILNVNPDPEMDSLAAEHMQNLIKEYRKKVLGETCLVTAPDLYWEVGTVTELHWTISEWRAMPLRERAMITARSYLSNMVQTIDRHYSEQDESNKRNREEIEEKRKGKK